MSLQELVPLYYKDIKMRYLRFNSIHKVTRLSQLVVIRHAEYGTLTRAHRFRCSKATPMISSLVLLTMKETP